MKKVFLFICVLSFIGCASAPKRDKINKNSLSREFYEKPSVFDFSRRNKDISSRVDFYSGQEEALKRLKTIALLPAGYTEKIDFDSMNFPDKEFMRILRETIKAELIEGYYNKYADSLDEDTTSNWSKYIKLNSYSIKRELIYSSLKGKHKYLNKKICDSTNKLIDKRIPSIISPSSIDSLLDSSDFYCENKISHKYDEWGGQAKYISICDSITNIVESEFLSDGTYTLISPMIAKHRCDSIYNVLDDSSKTCWISRFYPISTPDDSIECDKLKNDLSRNILKCLKADAYVIVDVQYKHGVVLNGKTNKYYNLHQILMKTSILGNDFNPLWSACYPISKQITQSVNQYKQNKVKCAYEIIDYNMIRENLRRTLSLLKSNKISN
jgi:hypothetical protein